MLFPARFLDPARELRDLPQLRRLRGCATMPDRTTMPDMSRKSRQKRTTKEMRDRGGGGHHGFGGIGGVAFTIAGRAGRGFLSRQDDHLQSGRARRRVVGPLCAQFHRASAQPHARQPDHHSPGHAWRRRGRRGKLHVQHCAQGRHRHRHAALDRDRLCRHQPERGQVRSEKVLLDRLARGGAGRHFGVVHRARQNAR